MIKNKSSRRAKIKKRIRGKVLGTAELPRLCVYRSNKAIYAQIILPSLPFLRLTPVYLQYGDLL